MICVLVLYFDQSDGVGVDGDRQNSANLNYRRVPFDPTSIGAEVLPSLRDGLPGHARKTPGAADGKVIEISSELPPLRDLRPAPANRETAHVFVRETVRMGILNGFLPGGSRLVQSDLAEELEVSTTPVREALRDLASEGLIKIDPHRGGIVCQLDRQDVEEIYLIRQHLEPLAIELAAPNISAADIEQARILHEAMSSAPDSAAWVELNRKFHMVLCTPCNRPRLLGTLQKLQDGSVMAVSSNIRAAAFRGQANVEHGQLVDALEAGDVEKATAVMLDHITVSLRSTQSSA